MDLYELDFEFPGSLIAQQPAEPRDSCRLMYLAADGTCRHGVFSDLPDLLRPGDALVFNDSKVLPARVEAHKTTGGRVELLFLKPCEEPAARGGEVWEALARPSHRLREGSELKVVGGRHLFMHRLLGEGRWIVEAAPGVSLVDLMEAVGRLPLPPYIRTYPSEPSAYQTVYAASLGSAAAPTAGLHFTPGLLERLGEAGIRSAHVTLHVGLDTFQPIRERVVEDHRIHREAFSVEPEALAVLDEVRGAGGRIVAVGTTVTRVLETIATPGGLSQTSNGRISGATEIFITPGYRFRTVDALLTNFHLPRSSVLALTMAFAGVERLRAAYSEAIDLAYRFFSFGDAMLIEPQALEMRGEGRDHAHT